VAAYWLAQGATGGKRQRALFEGQSPFPGRQLGGRRRRGGTVYRERYWLDFEKQLDLARLVIYSGLSRAIFNYEFTFYRPGIARDSTAVFSPAYVDLPQPQVCKPLAASWFILAFLVLPGSLCVNHLRCYHSENYRLPNNRVNTHPPIITHTRPPIHHPLPQP
jgi:hypothetical protein